MAVQYYIYVKTAKGLNCMKSFTKNQLIVISIAVAATLFSLLFLNRWFISNVPVEVFARVWQYYVGYQDVGFARRLLVGTVISASHVTDFFQNEFVFGHVFHSVTIVALAGILLHYIFKKKAFNQPFRYLAIFFSPFLIQQMGSTTGNLDVILVILAAISIFYVRSLKGVFLLSVTGLLGHELFIFLVPAILLIHSLQKKENIFSGSYILTSIGLAAAFLLVTLGGKLEMDQPVYEQIVAQKIPLAAYQHSLWSGYFELTTSVQQNITEGESFIHKYIHYYRFACIPTGYTLFLVLSVVNQKSIESNRIKWLLFLSFCFPVAATFFAIDYYRWLGLSANLSIIFMVYLIAGNQLILRKWQWAMLVLCCLLAPFGGNEFHLPLPLHQPLLQKLGFNLF